MVNAVSSLTSSPVCTVEIKPYKKNRSKDQNRLMWMWYSVIADYTGYHEEELHDQMKIKVLGLETIYVDGKPYTIPTSTKTLTVDQMTKFLDAIMALAAELNINLPMPDTFGYAYFGETL